MTPGKRKLVRTIVFEAFNLFEEDSEARQAFLRERCKEDPELLPIALEEVEAEAKIRQGRFLEKPAAAVWCGVIPEGTLIGEYRIGSLIGEGAMGAVYRARQTSLDRDIAVKTLRTPLASQAGLRFLSEAKTLSRIACERVIHVYAYGDYNGQPYIAMEYVEGTTLAQMIEEERLPDVGSRLAIALQIAEGLEQIHLANIVHRDVKPSNVLVDLKGNVKLIDFGIAWREDSRMTEIGQALGTPAYMPPEQILRRLGGSATDVEQYKRVDIYSFGILLYELFTGELPFQGETRGEVERDIVHTPVPLDPIRQARVPEGVVELIRLACSKNPAARPRSFGEVTNVLRIYTAAPPAAGDGRPARARFLRIPISVAGAILVAGLASYQLRPGNAVRLSPAADPAKPGKPDLTRESGSAAMPMPAVASSGNRNAVAPPVVDSAPPPKKTPGGTPVGLTVGQSPVVEPKTPDPAAGLPALPVAIPTTSPTAAILEKVPDLPIAVESAEDRDWSRVRDTGDAAALLAFSTKYPGGRYAGEARKAAASIEYQKIKGSNSAELLQSFADKYPENPLAHTAASMANQLKARTAAATEIGETLSKYAAAIRGRNMGEMLSFRELDKQQQAIFQRLFHESHDISMTLTATSSPKFQEPILADPSAIREAPMHAVVECALNMLVVSGSGDVQPEQRPVTVHLKRTANRWVITSY